MGKQSQRKFAKRQKEFERKQKAKEKMDRRQGKMDEKERGEGAAKTETLETGETSDQP